MILSMLRKCAAGIFLMFLGFNFIFAGSGHKIEIKIKDYSEEFCYLTYYYGKKKYLIRDTLFRTNKGMYVAQGDEPLEAGLYAIVLPPQNGSFEVMVSDDKNQFFSMETDTSDVIGNLKIKGSEENKAFYEYLRALTKQNKERKALEEKGSSETDARKKQALFEQITAIDKEVKALQDNYINKNKGWLSAAMILASRDVEIPDPTTKMTEDEEGEYRMNYYRTHFFDNIDFSDARLLRTPIYYSKLDFYLKRLCYQVPDSLNNDVDYVLNKAKANKDIYKFTLFDLIPRYGNAKVVGMDAVFVHLVEKYVEGQKFEDVDEEKLAEIVKTAKDLKPLLIGKKAPNMTLQSIDGEDLSLYDIKSKYTVVYFWDPKCGHCKKSAPVMNDFYNAYKDKGVALYAVCTKDKNKEMCMESIKEKGTENWTNVLAMTDRQLYYRLYYRIKTTPVIYVLDENKTILSKNIGAKQLPDVMNMFMEMDKK